MTDENENQTPQTVYIVCQGQKAPGGERKGAYMHDDMIEGVYTDESAVEDIPAAKSIPLGAQVDEIYYETELDPDD